MTDRKVLREFVCEHGLDRTDRFSVITAKDLAELKIMGYSAEDLFDDIIERYQVLLHGSRLDISDNHLKPGEKGEVYGSDLAAIAIMKAIISNRTSDIRGLVYDYFIDDEHPLEVTIYGMRDDTIGENGFVYLIPDRNGFENNPRGSWQYVRNRADVPITAKIEVLREDFKYPIFEAMRIQ